jgi:hypothetical protein
VLNYKVRARTQTSVEKLLANVLNLKAKRRQESVDGHLRGVLHAELGALSALPGSLVGLVTSMEKDF